MVMRSIQGRIATCFAVLLLLLGLSAGLSLVAGQRVSVNFSQFGVAYRATAGIASAMDATALVQLRVKEYVGSETGGDRLAALSAIADLKTVLGKLQTRNADAVTQAPGTANDLAGIANEISEATIARHAAGAQIADTGAALSGILVGTASAAARQASAELTAGLNVIAANAQRASLFSTRYLLSNSPSDIAAAKAEVANTLLQLKSLADSLNLEDGSRSARQIRLAMTTAFQLNAAITVVEQATTARNAAIARLDSDIQRLKTSMENMKREFDLEAQSAEQMLARGLRQASVLVASFTVVAVLLGIVCTLVIRSTCVKPLVDLVGSVRALAAGNLAAAIGHIPRNDEIGEVARALDSLKQAALNAQAAQHRAAAFTAAAIDDRRRVVHASADATEKALGELARSVGRTMERLSGAADELSGIAGQTSGRAADVVARSVDGRVRAEQVSAEAGRLAERIGDLEDRIANAAAGTAQATIDAQETESSVRSLAGAADGVDAASRLIAEVAQRTKLLAINAAMEAARSGMAGRGFTVVATEVKALAVQTAAATEQITKQVQVMRLAVGSSAGRIDDIRKTVASINQLTLDVADTFREQHAFMQDFVVAAAESASKAGVIANAMQAVLHNTAEVVRSADDLRQVAAEVSSQGNSLDVELCRVVGQLRAA